MFSVPGSSQKQGDTALGLTTILVYLVPEIRKQHSLEEDASALGPRSEEKTENLG